MNTPRAWVVQYIHDLRIAKELSQGGVTPERAKELVERAGSVMFRERCLRVLNTAIMHELYHNSSMTLERIIDLYQIATDSKVSSTVCFSCFREFIRLSSRLRKEMTPEEALALHGRAPYEIEEYCLSLLDSVIMQELLRGDVTRERAEALLGMSMSAEISQWCRSVGDREILVWLEEVNQGGIYTPEQARKMAEQALTPETRRRCLSHVDHAVREELGLGNVTLERAKELVTLTDSTELRDQCLFAGDRDIIRQVLALQGKMTKEKLFSLAAQAGSGTVREFFRQLGVSTFDCEST